MTGSARAPSGISSSAGSPVLPLPLTDHDADAGFWWELSMRQVEISRTLVFDAPRRARSFFEALVADNLDIGRPDSVELIFTGHAPHSRSGRPPVPGLCKTKIVTRDTDVTVNAFYKHSRIKQYLKDGRALRIETVVNSPDDLRCHRRLEHLAELRPKPVTSTKGCSILNVSGRAVSLRAQPLSGSRSPRLPRTGRGLRPCGSVTPGSWPCSAPCVSALPPSDSTIGAFVPG